MPAAYEWSGDLFCEDDILYVLTEQEPWSEWVENGGELDTTRVDEVLEEIREAFEEQGRTTPPMPVKRRRVPRGTICRNCLQFFSLPASENT